MDAVVFWLIEEDEALPWEIARQMRSVEAAGIPACCCHGNRGGLRPRCWTGEGIRAHARGAPMKPLDGLRVLAWRRAANSPLARFLRDLGATVERCDSALEARALPLRTC